ncbi:hypothetical protein FOCC_FOCC011032 [Frankliniella occidentalis]|nr:hypothetical protein FOCC_FOCC011032 [Frankliniella occidentalis]
MQGLHDHRLPGAPQALRLREQDHEGCVAQDDDTLQLLEEEWRKFPSLSLPPMKDAELIKNADQFWHAIRAATDACGDRVLRLLPDFALSTLSVPHSNAGCERDFSKINNVKTKTRNRLITPTVRAAEMASQAMRRGPPAAACCHSWTPDRDLRARMTASVIYQHREQRPAGQRDEDDTDIEFHFE